MQNFNMELFSQLFFLNLSKNFNIDENFSIIAGQASPAASSQSALEPPTPPRTPVIAAQQQQQQQQQQRSAEKNYNNNNDDAKENFEENSMRQSSSSRNNTPIRVNPKSVKSENESDFEDFPPRRPSHFNDDSNFSDDERGRQSVVSGSGRFNGTGDESEHESDYASSFDSSKLSMKNVESFLDKSNVVSDSRVTESSSLLIAAVNLQNFYNPMMQLTSMQHNDQAEKQLIGE